VKTNQDFVIKGKASDDLIGKTVELIIDNQFKVLGGKIADDGTWQINFVFLSPGNRRLKVISGEGMNADNANIQVVPSTITTAQKVLGIAAREIGYHESPKKSNNNKFGIWYGTNYQPWCAMFVSYCFYNAGLPLPATTPKGFAFCPFGVNWFKNKGWWHKTPQVGDVVFYDWGGDGVANHVGIVEKVNSDGSIVAIEGNTSDGVGDSNGGEVCRKPQKKGVILGYGRPPYENGDVPPPPPHPVWEGRYIQLTSPYMDGDDVLLWQKQMIERGWTLDADSVFDERDHKVLIKFQRQNGLEVDGVIGPISWNAAWTFPITPD
jgi:peptidoglycan hydrolase-like protein with peptidoglycan-binding domain